MPAIADRLVELLTDPGTMGEKGRAWAQAEWGWDTPYRRQRVVAIGEIVVIGERGRW